MKAGFDAKQGLVVVEAELTGPHRAIFLWLAVDTGATSTVIDADHLRVVGYDPATAINRTPVMTTSGIQHAAIIPIGSLYALGHRKHGLAVTAMTLPPGSGVDGLLGLDFLRGLSLTVDFRAGEVELQ
jgi:predicted aspartyl protease